MIQLIEELSLNAWPAVRQVFMDRWLLRFSDGYTRRANSVNILDRGQRPAEEKIVACENLYRARRQKCTFKLTKAAGEELETELTLRGYHEEGRVSVQTADLRSRNATAEDPQDSVYLRGACDRGWCDAFASLSELRPMHRPAMDAILHSIIPERRFALLTEGDEPVAAGLAVVERGWVGLFDIITRPDRRRRGYARRLIAALLEWARQAGARDAYLQVVTTNTPALALYGQLGFAEAYQYWYRVRELEDLDRESARPRVISCRA